ncbi:2-hydroxy-6-oxonona-2,4-dienedioate hydrolase/4,5:9,10-diseco-3-hydroxy-5,9,17-trioxoandrosta-1(10),2-diene-4-oate hydrolase [Actinacidiphila alni]|uniref:2-hydroxy-6-oxonona-2,4-dienedioate hydrolase/4,5:9,10-diseco-3-hydroxy-5,9,17-trioxoandrosta-1(10),2-diene-4-oate hydrolase n=1 Tax=Actinacidiphila alni TaxID=380248 RepID=A0A1I2KNM4_9ACTN|nr:alpha/beta fold hydrolase [Actinacidiphila alni]SFF66721.1 2-hydroxy-6-oxonona-2,4-dienedioate hydrolase/4,5:9,10-diseco-3-hydroxy-5,9,17-trioxoandrosta-1(10),2-diene-4-oate hydrolase [Actinacidiphila alni]
MTTTPTGLPAMQETTYDIGGRKIFAAETGEGPPVLLLHGGGPGASGVSNYARNIAELATEHRVIVPDLPGYGRSTKGVDGTDPFGCLADGVRGLLDELNLDRAHLVGNSYGGAAALRLALDTPDRVDRLVLMGPGGIGTTRALPTPGLNSLLDYYSGDGPSRQKLEKFIRNYLVFNAADVPDAAIDERYRASIDPEVIASPPLRRPSGLNSLRTVWKMDFTRDPRLSRLPVPTLVLWGAQDRVNRPSGGPMLAERMPNCDLYLVANTGHWVQFERAELFNRLCTDFLAGRR